MRSPIPRCSASSRTRATSIGRKANERNLSLNHARYRTVADLSEGAVYEYLMNAQGVYELEWTLGTERVYGCSEEEYRRRGWQSFLVGDGWEEQSLARTQRYLRGETVEFTAQIRRADGELRWIEVRNRPIADPATGKFTRLVGVAIDITERKQAADALRESEFRYRTVAELTSGFVYEATVDEHGEAQVVWASPGWRPVLRRHVRRAQPPRLAPRVLSGRSRRRHPAPPAAAHAANAPRWSWR